MNAPENSAPAAPRPSRSEALLPADDNDPALEVAEEVAFDLQSEAARQVGSLPSENSPAADALAETLRPDTGPGAEDGARPR